MVNRKKKKTSLPLSTSNITECHENHSNSDLDSFVEERYPLDNKYAEYLKSFKVCTQDRKEASCSKSATERINKENKEIGQKCAKCLVKYTKKMFFMGCCFCLKWFCLECSLLTRKEAADIKKSKEEWKCGDCFRDSNEFQNLKVENMLLRNEIHNINQKMEYLLEKIEKLESLNTAVNFNKIEGNFEKLFKLLEARPASKIQDSNKTYAYMLKNYESNKCEKENLPVVVIKPKRPQSCKITKEEVQNKVNPVKIKATVKEVKDIRNGGIVIKGNTKEELQNIKKLSEEQLDQNYSVHITKMKQPRLVILGPRKNYTSEELLEEMKALDYIDQSDTLEIKYSRLSKRTKKYILFIETSGHTFKKLVNMEVSLGWDNCFIKEDLNILICYNCSGYGHKTKECRRNRAC